VGVSQIILSSLAQDHWIVITRLDGIFTNSSSNGITVFSSSLVLDINSSLAFSFAMLSSWSKN